MNRDPEKLNGKLKINLRIRLNQHSQTMFSRTLYFFAMMITILYTNCSENGERKKMEIRSEINWGNTNKTKLNSIFNKNSLSVFNTLTSVVRLQFLQNYLT